MSMSADDLNTMNWVCVRPLVLLIMAFCVFVAWLSSSGSMVSVEPDPCQGAADERATSDGEPRTIADNVVYEIPAVNPWSAVYTGQHIYAPDPLDPPQSPIDPMTPEQAERFLALLEAADHDDPPRSQPQTHCPLCVIEMCDEWGIPFDPARVIGPRKYCHLHRYIILASARQGA